MAEKSSDAFRTISEVADDLNVPQHVLRFWEGRFPQIKPLKRAGGRRYYRPEDVELLARIRDLLYTQGYTIKGVQNLLKDGLDGTAAGDDAEALQPENADLVAEPLFAQAAPSQPPAPQSIPASLLESLPQSLPVAVQAPPPAAIPAPAIEAAPTAMQVEDPPMSAVMPGLFSRIEAVALPPASPPRNGGAAPLSPAVRGQLEAVVDELEQLRFLLRAQD
jgi:DNA-binding transcriptional MerR regulator